MKKTGAVVLAAGKSTRMGTFKPLLTIGRKSMIERIIEQMKAAGADPVVVVTGYKREVLEKHLENRDVILVHNKDYGANQMLDSLLIGLEAIKDCCGQVLVSPADAPVISRESAAAVQKAEGMFVRPVYHGEPGHPVRLDTDLLPVIKNYQGEGGLKGAMEKSGVKISEVSVDDPGTVMDVDTPEDYEKVRDYYNHVKRVVILGAGQMGRYLTDLIDRNTNRILAYGDNNSLAIDDKAEIPVLPVPNALNLKPDIIWIAVTGKDRIAAIKRQVSRLGYQGEVKIAADLVRDFNLRGLLLKRLASRIESHKVPGAVAELGVYRGDFAWQLQEAFPGRRLYLFDTFSGFTGENLQAEREKTGNKIQSSDFSDTCEEVVLEKLDASKEVIIRKGVFPETVSGINEVFSLVSLDADLYAPTLAGLEYFYPRLSRYGYIILHDYESSQFEGVKKAVQIYEKKYGKLLLVPAGDMHGTVLIIKGES